MAKNREVIYTLKLATDPGNAKAAGDLIAQLKATTAAQNESIKAMKEAATVTAKQHSAAGKSATRGMGGPTDPDFKKHAQWLGKQYAENERLAKQAAAASSKAWKEAGAAIVSLTSGVTSYGRAIVLATAADEESAHRMLQKLAAFEAFASVLSGTIAMVKAGTSAWKAYHAAQAAGGLAQAASSFAGGAGGRIAGGVAGGVAAGGMIAGAKSLGGAALGAATNPLTGVAMITAGTISAGYSVGMALKAGKSAKQGLMDTGNLLWEGTREFLGITDMAGDAAKAWKQRHANVAEQAKGYMDEAQHRASIENEDRARRRDLGMNRATRGLAAYDIDREKLLAGADGVTESNRPALAAARERLRQAEANYTNDQVLAARAGWDHSQRGAAMKFEADERLKDSKPELINALTEAFALEQKIKMEQIEAGRASLRALGDRKRELQEIVKTEENLRKSAAARFGSLNESEQRATLEAARAYKAGKPLDRDKESSLDALGGAGSDIANASREKRAFATPGYKELIDDAIYRPKITAPTAALAAIDAKTTNTFNVTITKVDELNKAAEEFKTKVGPLLKDSNDQQQRYVDEAIRRLRDEIQSTEALRLGTTGG